MFVGNSLLVRIVLVFLALLPFHSVFISGWFTLHFFDLSIWKELLVVIFFLISLTRVGTIDNDRLKFLYLISIYVVLIFFVFMIYSPSGGSLVGFRNYAFPILLFASAMTLKLDKMQYEKIMKFIFVIAVISCIYSIIQVHILTDQFLLDVGFEPNVWDVNKLKFSFYIHGGEIQRANGGFSGPIVFCSYLIAVLILAYDKFLQAKDRYVALVMFVIFFAIISTMLRSGLLAIFALFVFFYMNARAFKLILFFVPIVVSTVFFIYFFAGSYEFNETVDSFIGISSGSYDPSKEGHMFSYLYGLELLSASFPFGFGLGTIGPQSGLYFNESIVIESTILSLFIELGFFLGTLLLLYFVILLVHSKPNSFFRKMTLAIFIIGIFLPMQYYSELSYILAILFALSLNGSLSDEKVSI